VSNGASCVIQSTNTLGSGAYLFVDGLLSLPNSATNTVARLYLGGVLQPAGLWNAARDAVHFAGPGSLNVTEGSAAEPILLSGSRSADGTLILMWTNSASGLYFTSNLVAPVVWAPVTNLPFFSNGQQVVSLTVGTNAHGFYRLVQ
jgi:hypothetical protein